MTRIEIAIAILNDAKRDFRLKPDTKLKNNMGICLYVRKHPLCENLKFESIDKLLDIIGVRRTIFLFTGSTSQSYAWNHRIKGYNYERADFCKDKIKELQL